MTRDDGTALVKLVLTSKVTVKIPTFGSLALERAKNKPNSK